MSKFCLSVNLNLMFKRKQVENATDLVQDNKTNICYFLSNFARYPRKPGVLPSFEFAVRVQSIFGLFF